MGDSCQMIARNIDVKLQTELESHVNHCCVKACDLLQQWNGDMSDNLQSASILDPRTKPHCVDWDSRTEALHVSGMRQDQLDWRDCGSLDEHLQE